MDGVTEDQRDEVTASLENLACQAEQEDREESPGEPISGEVQASQALATATGVMHGYNGLIQMVEPRATLDKETMRQGVNVLVPVCEKYEGAGSFEYAPEVAAVLFFGSLTLQSVATIKALRREDAKRAADQARQSQDQKPAPQQQGQKPVIVGG